MRRQLKLAGIIKLVCYQLLVYFLKVRLRALCRKDDKSGEIKSIDADARLFYPAAAHLVREVLLFRFHRVRRSVATLASLAIFVPSVAVATQSNAPSSTAPAAQPVTRSALAGQLDSNFNNLDTNKDKSLNRSEIEAAQARNVAQAKAEIAKRVEAEFVRLDGNKDGQLSMAEFKGAASTPRVPPVDDLLKQLDRNGDGKVTQDEFRATPLANFDRIDTNKDGSISDAEKSAATRQQR